jgi:hypothetical protein
MTLKEKFENIEHLGLYKDEYSLPVWSTKVLDNQTSKCEQIADEFAIGFFDWFNSKEAEDLMHDLVIVGEVDINTTTKELLEIYKKEL